MNNTKTTKNITRIISASTFTEKKTLTVRISKDFCCNIQYLKCEHEVSRLIKLWRTFGRSDGLSMVCATAFGTSPPVGCLDFSYKTKRRRVLPEDRLMKHSR